MDSKGKNKVKYQIGIENKELFAFAGLLPDEFNSNDFESKGFYERTLIQDFPMRGKAVYLGIRRRRWRSKTDKSLEIKSDYSLIAEGSKLTIELSNFFKRYRLRPEKIR